MSIAHRAAMALGLLAAAGPAAAHISLENQQAPANSIDRAVFRVPHGCGEAATTRITVRLPEGFIQARPMPKPGWTLRVTYRGEAPSGHGAIADAAEIVREGGSLPNAHYDEFVIRMRLPDRRGELVYIPVIQDCEGGASTGWVQIPEAGRRASDYPHIAPAIRLASR
jgi:uncharacterized protein YcnI